MCVDAASGFLCTNSVSSQAQRRTKVELYAVACGPRSSQEAGLIIARKFLKSAEERL